MSDRKWGMKKALLLLSVVLAAASSAGATTMTYTVAVNTTVSPETFDVYAYCPGSDGLDILSFDITATGNISFLSGSLKAVTGIVTNEDGDLYGTGFYVDRNSGVRSSQLIHGVHAYQPACYGDVNDPFLDSLVIQNLGTSAPYLVYHGTFSGDSGQIYLSHFDGSVLMNFDGGPWVGPGNILGTTTQRWDQYGHPIPPLTVVGVPPILIPEPVTLSLLALGGLALIRRRR